MDWCIGILAHGHSPGLESWASALAPPSHLSSPDETPEVLAGARNMVAGLWIRPLTQQPSYYDSCQLIRRFIMAIR